MTPYRRSDDDRADDPVSPLYVTDELDAQKRFYEASFGFEAVFFDAGFYLHLHHRGSGRPDRVHVL